MSGRRVPYDLKCNFEELKNIYQLELLEHRAFNRKATIKLLLTALPLLLIAIALFSFEFGKHHIIPWYLISGFAGLYFIVRAIILQINSHTVSTRANSKVDKYLRGITRTNLTVFQMSNESLEIYIEGKLESECSWSELNMIIEKEKYFYLSFNKGKIILIPKNAVQPKFYQELLLMAKTKVVI